MQESRIQNKIRIALSDYGIVIRMQSGYFKAENGSMVKQGLPGIPDLLFIGKHGKVAWLEVKAPKGIISEQQQRFIDMLRSMGHTAGVVRSVQDALDLVGVSAIQNNCIKAAKALGDALARGFAKRNNP